VNSVLVLMPLWAPRMPPLGLAGLKAAALSSGFSCRAIDFSTEFPLRNIGLHRAGRVQGEILKQEAWLQKAVGEILKDKPSLVGFSVLLSNQEVTRAAARLIRKQAPATKIICGGARFISQEALQIRAALEFCDVVVEGEGEETFCELLERVAKGQALAGIPQLWTKDREGGLVFSGPRPLPHLDTRPMPDFDDFELGAYEGGARLPMLFSRGCVANCTFCSGKWNHKTQRTRLGAKVFDELVRNVERYGISSYAFNDDSLISSVTHGELEDFADRTISSGHVLPWLIHGSRADRVITDRFVRKLAKSGLASIRLGIESFSSRVRRDMRKGCGAGEADRCIRLFFGHGVDVCAWLIYGYPSETQEDFEETLSWLRANGSLLKDISVSAFTPNLPYRLARPGVVRNWGTEHWQWQSSHSSLSTRMKRFVALLDVAAEIRARRNDFGFWVQDPVGAVVFTRWDARAREQLFQSWEGLATRSRT
jgi:radical SAM superfamily enzyme YgiQ (UPF0313 family)